MFTNCPECNKIHQLSVNQLRASRGMIRCTNCSNLFDCLELLCDQPELEADIETPSETINWNQDAKQNSSPHWIAGFVLGLALLAFQTYNLKSTFFTQHHLFRPWLINTCSLLNCQLPIYKNPAELEVLHSSFEPLDPLSYRFQIAISNEAPFSQPYPKIKLVLVDFLGKSFAERVFYPNEYFSNYNNSNLVSVNTTFEISMDIAVPDSAVGGYRIELM